MKKSIFLFFAAILYATSAWGVDTFKDGQYIYYQIAGNSNWTQATYVPMFGWYWDSGNWCNKELGKEVPGTDKAYYYQIVPNAYIGYVQIMRMNGNNTSEEWNYSNKKGVPADKTQNCYFFKSASWSGGDLSIKTYAPPMSSVTLADNGTTVNSGTGTQADPYIIEIGTKIKVQASGTKAVDDPDAVINYAFKYGATSQDSETTTWEIDANSPSTTYAIELEGYTKVNTTSSEKKAATKLYYQTVADATLPTYQVTVTANDPAMGTVTGAGEYSEGATAELTATPNVGYKFVNWTVGSTEKSTNPTYSFTVTENVTLVANFQAIPEETVYFINTNEWTGTINAYAWTDGTPKVENAGWAGLAATKEDFQIGGYDVYSYTAKQGLYANVIFNGTGGQTTDLTWQAGKYYAPSKEKWYDTKEAAAEALATPLADETVYFVNNKQWASVAIYGWGGTASTSEGIGKWAGTDMTKTAEQVAGFDVYSYTAKEGTVKNILFNYNGDENKTSNFVWTDGKYYYMNAADNYAGGTAEEVATALGAIVSYDYYIYGNMNDWKEDANYGMTDENEDGIYEKTLTFKNNAEFKVKGTAWYGFEKVEGTYKEASENSGNIKLTLGADTEVTVKFNSETKKITFEGLTEIVPKYYIVGTFNSWDTADPNYEMTLEGGVYKKVVTFAKDVEFKVCDGTWSKNWGKNNLGGIQYNELTEKDDNIKMKEAKTFTVIFNPAENLILFEGLTEKVTYVLMGVNGDWDNGIELTPNPKKAGEYMLLAQTIAKATDAVKIVKIEGGNKTQYCQFENVKDGSVTCTEDTHKNIVLEDGIYNFYYTTNDNKVYIETSTPAHTRTVPAGYYATVCLPNNIINVVGATLFEVAGKEGNKVIFDEVLTPVAGMPYIFLAEENTISFYCGIETAATPGNHESLHGTFEDMVDADLDGMYMVQNNKIVKCAATGCNIPKNRAYFKGTELDALGVPPAPMPDRRRITMGAEGENTTTGVEGIVVPEGQTIKVISNGQLIIIRNGEMYNAQGQKL